MTFVAGGRFAWFAAAVSARKGGQKAIGTGPRQGDDKVGSFKIKGASLFKW